MHATLAQGRARRRGRRAVTPFLLCHSAGGRPPESQLYKGRYYWQFCKISQDFLRLQLQTSKERRGIGPDFAKLRI